MDRSSDITAHLLAWSQGDQAAGGALLDAVYYELRRLAGSYLRRERRDHSLPPTALVHEAYLKLVDQRRVHWRNRSHFFGIAAQAMRRILVDRARAGLAVKRGGGALRVGPTDGDAMWEPPGVDLVALDAALSRLESVEPRWSRLVELRFFAGLTVEETAAVLTVSPATVKRDWGLARAWLYRELN
jgi:RNA polymerase sigma factor (TIGR02999 family)